MSDEKNIEAVSIAPGEEVAYRDIDELLDAHLGVAPTKEAAPVVEEVAQEVDAPSQERVDELIAKNDAGGELTAEEIAELTAAGYEMQEAEGQPEPVAENENWKAPEYADRLKEVFPEGEFNSPEAIDEAVNAALDNLKAYHEYDQKLTKITNENPEVKIFLEQLAQGKSVMKALLEAGLDPNDVVPKPGEDGYEDYVFETRQKKQRLAEKEQNLARSTEEVKTFFETSVPDVKMRAKIGEELTRHFNDISNGKITSDLVKLVHKGLTKDADVDAAKRQGKVEGLNEKITVQKKFFKRTGDGIGRPSQQANSIIKKQAVTYANDGSKELYGILGIK
jgi:hypothetical protein